MNRPKMKTKFSMYLLLSIFLVAFLPNLATAVIETTGNIAPAYPVAEPDPWNITVSPTDSNWADLIIGNTANGRIDVNDSSWIQNSTGYIGNSSTFTGTVDVNDAGWYNNRTWDGDLENYWGGNLYVGYEGTGVLNITNGGYVYADANSYIGFAPGSSGTVTVTDGGHWETNGVSWWDGEQTQSYGGDLIVGYGGTGTMVISDTGYVYSDMGIIGYEPNSTGSVTVTGGQSGDGWWASEWQIDDALVVGYEGDGTLLIEDGGRVTVGGPSSVYIGDMPGSTGSVTVTGGTIYDEYEDGPSEGQFNGDYQERSGLYSNGPIYVGVEGTGTLLVEDGAYVESYGGYIGDMEDSIGSVTVTGPEFIQEDSNDTSSDYEYIEHSRWTNYGWLIVGNEAEGTRLEDGSVENYGGTLSIEDGGYVYSGGAAIGHQKGSTGMVTVTGPGSYQESVKEDNDNRWEIDGSWWNINGELVVAEAGEGVLNITDGGRVTSYGGSIGSLSGSRGMVTVTGGEFWQAPTDPNDDRDDWWIDGSVWEMDDYYDDYYGNNLFVGEEGEGTLLISDGGRVIQNRAYYGGGNAYIGYAGIATGSVTVTGPNSVWEMEGDLFVGGGEDEMFDMPTGGEGMLLIEDGGAVYTGDSAYIGAGLLARGNVTVTGPNSVWEIDNDLVIGEDEGHAVLNVDNGGYVGVDDQLTIGQWGGNGAMNVTNGSEVEVDEDILVGHDGGNGEMLISGGSRVKSEWAMIGTSSYSNGVATVTGPNSVWENQYQLIIGGEDTPVFLEEGPPSYYTSASTGLLNISDGAVVEAGSVLVAPGGTLTGDGTLRLTANSVLTYGTIKPGNSIGTLTIDGDLRIREGSVLEVEIDNSGNSDLLSVTGDVNIVGGTVQPVPTESILGTQQYTIIEANSVDGEFDTIDTALLDSNILLSETSLGYEPNDAGLDLVMLNVDAKRFDDPRIAQSDNQQALGGALQRILEENGGNSITQALQGLETEGEVRDAYDQLSGQIRPQIMPVAAVDTDKFMGVVSDRMNYAGQGVSYYGSSSSSMLAMSDQDPTDNNSGTYSTRPNFAIGNNDAGLGDKNLGIWGKGYGVFGDRSSGGGVAGYDYTVYGSSFGVDYQVSDDTLMGITAGTSKSVVDSSLAGNNSDIESKHIGIYTNKKMEEWQIDTILTGSILEYDTERYVSFLGERLNGESDGKAISGYIEARYDWQGVEDSWLLQPLAAFQFSLVDIDSYTEDGGLGGSSAALSYDDQDYNSFKGSLGIKLTKDVFNQDNVRSANVQLRGRWIHEFGDDNSSVDASFLSDPGVVFKVSDDELSRDSFVLGASVNAGLSRNTQISLGYDAQLNSDDTMHILSAMFVYRW